MCKLMILTGIVNGKNAVEFMKQIAVPMSRLNDDGIGYTAVNAAGDLFSQRWHKNHMFMDQSKTMSAEMARELAPMAARLPAKALEVNYDETGDIDLESMTSVTLHTRYATCGTEMANTHPFIYNDTSLIHNGMIRNHLALNVNKISSCDSEAALQTYITTGVMNDTAKVQEWIDMLAGYWAFGIFARNNYGNRILDVVRGTSNLYYLEVEELGRVFTTDKDDAVMVCKAMNLTISKEPGMIAQHILYRFDSATGDLMEEVKFKESTKNYVAPKTDWSSRGYYGADGKWKSYSSGSYSTTQSTFGEIKDDLSSAYTQGSEDESEYPDIFNARGKFDLAKVTKYVNDANEPLIDRLDIWDMVYNKDLTAEFEALGGVAQAAIEETDFMHSFKQARELIIELSKTGVRYSSN